MPGDEPQCKAGKNKLVLSDPYYNEMQHKPSYLTSGCTGLPAGWTDVESSASFPEPHNTPITVSCPTGYELGGDTTVTCDEGTTFTYTTIPSCTIKSKSLVDSCLFS